MKKYQVLIFVLFLSITNVAQHPLRHWTDAIETRYDTKQPVVHYILTIDTNDLSSIFVEMRLRNIPDSFRVAMMAHPEYDDRYWRFIEGFYADTKNGHGKIERIDSALWKITGAGNEAVLHYRIHLPEPQTNRSAWRPFITPTGGLFGGPHSFMYVVGATLIPSYVTLKLPAEWKIATGLTATADPNTFFAASVALLLDDPIVAGKLNWRTFYVDGVPHHIVYWPLPQATTFDTANFHSSIEKLVKQTALFFGRLPYREYFFLLQDGAFGALEHNNSVTVGAPGSQLAIDLTGHLSEIAHEYFHTWNLMRIHPVEYADVDYKTPALSKGLWFSEGLTIFYADLLSRRAGVRVFDSTRIVHLENLIRRYSNNPAYTKFSAEKISLAAYGPIGMLGDYSAGTHLQGEVIGTMLDIIIRNNTNGKRSMDDVMIKMLERFSGEKGFTSKDIQQAVTDICGCNVQTFFEDHVFGIKPIDFNKWLQLIGLQSTLGWKEVVSNDGKPLPDLRVFAYQLPNETVNRIGITNPNSAWGKAGLHTGDIIKAVNGTVIKTAADFRPLIREASMGDTIIIEVQRNQARKKIYVLITSYQQPVIHINEMPNRTEQQKDFYEEWLN